MSERDSLDYAIWLRNMIRRVKESNDPSELIEAINSHPTGLLTNEQVREVIIESLKGNHLRKDVGRPRKVIERDSRLFVDMLVMHMEGMSIPEAAEILEGALEQFKEEMEEQGLEVSEKFAIKADQIGKKFREERERRGIELKKKKGHK
ncbi:flagellar hook-length control protein FliK [Litoricolaceae bacterium]|nr:flagellar hook-length control protein FliK [Litorivicinaceae bacterium]